MKSHPYALGRSHEFGPDRIVNVFRQDAFHLVESGSIELEVESTTNGLNLIGAARTPKYRTDSRTVESPPDREIDHGLSEAPARKIVQALNCALVLTVARLRKFWIDAPQIVPAKRRALGHAAAQQATAENTVGDRRQFVLNGIR